MHFLGFLSRFTILIFSTSIISYDILVFLVCHTLCAQKIYPFLLRMFKSTCLKCKVCTELKPRFYRKSPETLIKATKPWEIISINFKSPLTGKNRYIFLVVDEFSRYPFDFECSNTTSSTVIDCLG